PPQTTGQPKVRGQAVPGPAAVQGKNTQVTVTWKERHAIKMDPGTQTFSACLSPDGKVAVVGTSQGLKFLDAVKGQELAVVAGDHTSATAISPDGKIIATGHIKAIKLWDAAGKPIATLAADAKNIARVAFAPDGKLLATAEVGPVRLWEVAT